MTEQQSRNQNKIYHILLNIAIFIVFISFITLINYNVLNLYQIKDKWSNTLIGPTFLPYVMAQGLIQTLAQYQDSYFWSLSREGILGQKKIKKYIIYISILFSTILTLFVILNNNQYQYGQLLDRKYIGLIIYSLISNLMFNIAINIFSEKGFSKNGISIVIWGQSLILIFDTLNKYLILKNELTLYATLPILITYLILLQKKTINFTLQNSVVAKQSQKSTLSLPYNSSGIFALLFTFIIYQFMQSLNINQIINLFIFVIALIGLNYIFTTIMINPELIAEQLQENNSYIVYQGKIVQSGNSTMRLIKKQIHKSALSFSKHLIVLSILGQGITYLTYNQINGISLICEIMLVIVLSYSLFWDVKKWILLGMN